MRRVAILGAAALAALALLWWIRGTRRVEGPTAGRAADAAVGPPTGTSGEQAADAGAATLVATPGVPREPRAALEPEPRAGADVPDSWSASLARVTGRIVEPGGEPGGKPVAELRVTLLGSASRETRTGAAGRFEFDAVVPGPPLALGLDLGGPRAELRFALPSAIAGATTDLGDIVLAARTIASGTVIDADGRPIAGAEVRAVPARELAAPTFFDFATGDRIEAAGGGLEIREVAVQGLAWSRLSQGVRADGQGRFAIALGPAQALAVAGPGYVASLVSMDAVELRPVVLERAPVLAITLELGDGAPAGDGAEVWTGMRLAGRTYARLRQANGPDGLGVWRAELAGRSGQLLVSARPARGAAWQHFRFDGEATLAELGDSGWRPLSIRLDPPSALTLHVSDPSGLPVAGAAVRLSSSSFGAPFGAGTEPPGPPAPREPTAATAVTDAAGAASFGGNGVRGLWPGFYALDVEHAEHGRWTAGVFQVPAQTELEIVLPGAQPRRIACVDAPSGAPLAGILARVLALPGLEVARATSDSEGWLELPALASPAAIVRFEHPARPPFVASFEALQAGSVVELPRAAALRGSVVPAPAPGEVVQVVVLQHGVVGAAGIEGAAPWTGTDLRAALAAPDGSFALEGLAPGSALVFALRGEPDTHPLLALVARAPGAAKVEPRGVSLAPETTAALVLETH